MPVLSQCNEQCNEQCNALQCSAVKDPRAFRPVGLALSTQCKCTINSGNEEIEVLQVEEGGYFGEIALLTDQPRKANVYAVSDCKLLSTDRATFKRVMGPLTDILSRNMDMYKKVLQDVGL